MNKVAVMMSVVSKVLGLVALGQTARESKMAVQRFFTGLTTALVFALMASMMLGAVIIGAHFLVYEILVTSTSLTTLQAMSLTFGAGLLLTAIFAGIAIWRVKALFDKDAQITSHSESSPLDFNPLEAGEKLGNKLGGIAEAFFTGLREAKTHNQPPHNTEMRNSGNVSSLHRRTHP